MLNTKQKSYLKSLIQTKHALYQCGKDGLSDTFIQLIKNSFNTHELIKIHILKTLTVDLKELAFDLSRLTNSEVVRIIGRHIVLYKAFKKPEIQLPR